MHNTYEDGHHISPKFGGWAALAVFILWLVAFIVSIVQSMIFPGFSDQFVPANIQAQPVSATLGWLAQIALGTAIVVMAVSLSDYLAAPSSTLVRFAFVAGIVGGTFLIAAGAVGQENVFVSVFFTSEQAQQLSQAMGTPDLTVVNATNNVVAGGLRSTSAYASGWAIALWSIAALRTKRFPKVLNWLGLATAIAYILTVWIGPFSGPIAFLGLLIWHGWLSIVLLRSPAHSSHQAVLRGEHIA